MIAILIIIMIILLQWSENLSILFCPQGKEVIEELNEIGELKKMLADFPVSTTTIIIVIDLGSVARGKDSVM